MSDLPPPPGGGFAPPPPPPPGGGFTPSPPPPGGYVPPPPPGGDVPPPPPGGYVPPPPPGGYVPPPPPGGYVPPPPVGYSGAAVASPRTDGLAIGALIAGIFSLICFWPLCLGIILGPAAAIMGFISRQRIAASSGTVGGGGLAVAGLVLGIIGFIASAAWAIFSIFLASHSNSNTITP